MRKGALFLCVFLAVGLCVFKDSGRDRALAAPGSRHEAAMAEVQRGIDITRTGKLDAAMNIFKRIDEQFPGEAEAIGWARYWHCNCLFAGLRKREVAPLMKPVWDQVIAGEITSTTAKFWFGHQYAKGLITGNVMRSVAEQTLRFADEIEEPGPQIKEKIGFLNVFLTRCYYSTREYVQAAAAAEAAWQAGENLRQTLTPAEAAEWDIKPTVLAAWGRLEKAKAELQQHNVLLAQTLLAECAEDYSPHMETIYASEVDTLQEECRLKLGLSEEVRAQLAEKLRPDVDHLDRGLWLRAAYQFATDAVQRDARDEAIGLLAVARNCYPDFPAWGLHISLLWERKIRGSLPDEAFLAELDTVKNSGAPLERAAIRIEMAELLAEMGRPEEGIGLLAEAEALTALPKLDMALRVAWAHCQSPGDVQAEVQAYEAVLAAATGNAGLARYIIKRVGPYYWDRDESPTYPEWLDARQGILTGEVYRQKKAFWLRDRAKDYDAALELLEPLLTNITVEEPWRVRVDRIVCLYRAGRDAEAKAAIAEYERAIHNLEDRERGFILACNSMYSRPEVALSLAERALLTQSNQMSRQDGLLLKGRMLIALGHYQEAIQVLEQLTGEEPSEVVGEGMMTLARLYYQHLKDPDTARTYYANVLANREVFTPVVPEAYQQYARMEEALGNDAVTIRICEEGIQNLLSSEVRARSWLRLIRARLRLRGDDPDSARLELKQLAETNPVPLVRRRAGYYLAKEGVGR